MLLMRRVALPKQFLGVQLQYIAAKTMRDS